MTNSSVSDGVTEFGPKTWSASRKRMRINRPRDKLFVVCLLMTSCLPVTFSLPGFVHENTVYVETIHIKHERSIHHVTKRSANQPADEVHVSFTAQNQPIKLRLKRHAHDGLQLPVYTLRHGQAVHKQIDQVPRVAFYHDRNHGAVFAFTRNHFNLSRPFDLEGSLFLNGGEYILTPDRGLVSVDGTWAAHALKRMNSRLTFGHDGIDERDPYTIYLSRQGEQRRRERRLERERERERGWRRKRQVVTPQTFYVELSMIADYAVWDKFVKLSGGDTDQAFTQLQHYYLFMAVMMDVRYQSVTEIDPSLAISVRPVSLIVTDIREESVWTESHRVGQTFVQAVYSLYTLRDWVKLGQGVPRADHTMLFTGYDLLGGQGDSSTIGVAFIGTACTYNSVSVIEEYFTGTTGAVSAHELGHSLDAEHDANYRRCSDRSANVMSTQAVFPTDQRYLSNPWKFSQCSVDAFGAFLQNANCTRDQGQAVIQTSEVGGVYFDADRQCQLAMGPASFFCRSVQVRKGYGDMCRHLYCYLPEEPGFCGSVIAAEFTQCGDHKWCSKGRCVADVRAAQSSDTCPQGDQPGL